MSLTQTDQPLRGIALMLAVCLTAPLADALAKILGAHLSVGQITTLRFLAQGLILIPLAFLLRRSWRMSPGTLALLTARTVLHVAAIGLIVVSLRTLPLADFIAIIYVMPFMALLLGRFFLAEQVGPHRIGACIAGFAGTLMVLQPAFSETGPAAFLPQGVALLFTLYLLLSRRLGPRLDPIAQQAAAAPIALLILLPPIAVAPAGTAATAWSDPGADLWPLVSVMSVIGTFAHLAMSWALKYAPASTLAPMQYLEIPAATLIGWLIWRDLPGPLASLGIALTMASGLYIVMHEHRLCRPAPASAVPPPAPPATPPDAPPAGSAASQAQPSQAAPAR